MGRGEGFKNLEVAKRAGKIGKANSPWNRGPSCGSLKAELSNLKFREAQNKKIPQDKGTA